MRAMPDSWEALRLNVGFCSFGQNGQQIKFQTVEARRVGDLLKEERAVEQERRKGHVEWVADIDGRGLAKSGLLAQFRYQGGCIGAIICGEGFMFRPLQQARNQPALRQNGAIRPLSRRLSRGM